MTDDTLRAALIRKAQRAQETTGKTNAAMLIKADELLAMLDAGNPVAAYADSLRSELAASATDECPDCITGECWKHDTEHDEAGRPAVPEALDVVHCDGCDDQLCPGVMGLRIIERLDRPGNRADGLRSKEPTDAP